MKTRLIYLPLVAAAILLLNGCATIMLMEKKEELSKEYDVTDKVLWIKAPTEDSLVACLQGMMAKTHATEFSVTVPRSMVKDVSHNSGYNDVDYHAHLSREYLSVGCPEIPDSAKTLTGICSSSLSTLFKVEDYENKKILIVTTKPHIRKSVEYMDILIPATVAIDIITLPLQAISLTFILIGQ